LDIGAAIFRDERAQRDAGIEIAGKIQIQDGAAVNAAASRLEFVDDFHGANLGRARKRSGRKAGRKSIKAIKALAQFPAQGGDEMHHVRIALDEHQAFDLHAAVHANAAKVVAAEVDKHDVFGALFRVGEKLGFELAVLFFVASARKRAGNRPVEDVAPLNLHEHLWRAADNGNVVETQ